MTTRELWQRNRGGGDLVRGVSDLGLNMIIVIFYLSDLFIIVFLEFEFTFFHLFCQIYFVL